MATGTEQAQSHVQTCLEHTHQPLLTYCRTCHKRVCEKCIKGQHCEHDWTFLQNHAREIRTEGQKITKIIREEVITFLKARQEGRAKKEEMAKLRRMQTTLKNLIDECTDEMMLLLDDKDQGTDVKTEIAEFQKLAVFFDKHVTTEYDSVVVEMEEDFQTKLRQFTALKAATKANVRRFHEGTVQKDILKSMIGRIEKVDKNQTDTARLDVNVMRTIRHGEEMIACIGVVSENEVWVDGKNTKKMYLLDRDGKERESKSYGTSFTHFIVGDKGHIFTCRDKKYIGRLVSGKISELCSTAPLSPNGICHSHDGGILVCLGDCSKDDIKPSAIGEIHHMDMTGRNKRIYMQDNSNKNKLLRWPYCIAQNITSDLCVIDCLKRNREHRLVVVTEESKVRFSYEGHPSLKKKCTFNAVACDNSGRIILCDGNNNAVHMLNSEGYFIQFLLTSEDGVSLPTALALYENKMWIGNVNGVIKLCELKQSL